MWTIIKNEIVTQTKIIVFFLINALYNLWPMMVFIKIKYPFNYLVHFLFAKTNLT